MADHFALSYTASRARKELNDKFMEESRTHINNNLETIANDIKAAVGSFNNAIVYCLVFEAQKELHNIADIVRGAGYDVVVETEKHQLFITW